MVDYIDDFNLTEYLGLGKDPTFHKTLQKANAKPDIYIRLTKQQHEALIENKQRTADNIRQSERLRAEITKGIISGSDQLDILIKAIECIGLMTGDKVFIEQNTKTLQTPR